MFHNLLVNLNDSLDIIDDLPSLSGVRGPTQLVFSSVRHESTAPKGVQLEFVGLETSVCRSSYDIVGCDLQHYKTHLPGLDLCLNCRLLPSLRPLLYVLVLSLFPSSYTVWAIWPQLARNLGHRRTILHHSG
jgi:hypothetical protein